MASWILFAEQITAAIFVTAIFIQTRTFKIWHKKITRRSNLIKQSRHIRFNENSYSNKINFRLGKFAQSIKAPRRAFVRCTCAYKPWIMLFDAGGAFVSRALHCRSVFHEWTWWFSNLYVHCNMTTWLLDMVVQRRALADHACVEPRMWLFIPLRRLI